MKTITGVFRSQVDVERAAAVVQAAGVHTDKVVLLTPGNRQQEEQSVHVVAGEQPGMGRALGAVVGTAVGLSGAPLIAAFIPGVGIITAAGLLGAAVLTAAPPPIEAIAWTSCAVDAPTAALLPPGGSAAMPSTTQGAPTAPIEVPENAFRLALY